jgi:hypothetical protein
MHSPRFAGFREGLLTFVPSVLGVALAVTLAFVFVVALVLLPLSARRAAGTFCTPDDAVFQAIRASAQIWVDQFTMQDTESLDFTTAKGETYTATRLEPDALVVVTENHEPRTLLGAKGYLYAPGGTPESFSDYTFTSLEGNIFCYDS